MYYLLNIIMHLFLDKFLYVSVIEYRKAMGGSDMLQDTKLRIVFWNNKHGGYFVIYGTRPYSNVSGHYSSYRVRCRTIRQVRRFVRTVISVDSHVAVELHQFDALNNSSDDRFNVDWHNNAENGSTEIVAFDFAPDGGKFTGQLNALLKQLVDSEIV